MSASTPTQPHEVYPMRDMLLILVGLLVCGLWAYRQWEIARGKE